MTETKTKTYSVSVLIPHYLCMEVVRPESMTEEEIMESLTYQDFIKAQRDELTLKDIFNDNDYSLSYIEELD